MICRKIAANHKEGLHPKSPLLTAPHVIRLPSGSLSTNLIKPQQHDPPPMYVHLILYLQTIAVNSITYKALMKRSLKPFHIDESLLIAGWCSAVLWGMYTILFGLYFILLRLKARNDRSRSSFQPINVAVSIMYLLATAHIAMLLYELIIGFTQTSTDAEEQIYFTYGTPQVMAMVKNLIYIIVGAMGDCIVLWRLFIIWNGNYWVTGISGTVIASAFVTGVVGSCAYVLPTDSGFIRTQTAVHFIWATISLSLVSNVLLTGLISGKIIYEQRSLSHLLGRSGTYLRVVLIVIESAAIITVARVFELALATQTNTSGVDPRGNNSAYVVNFSMPQILGIVPLIILIAVLAGFTHGTEIESTEERGQTRSVAGTIMFARPIMTRSESDMLDGPGVKE
ncbi:hypothetical protein GALMADRAFT_934629 [Galerina marginata CBS 339.88]|uniref:Integral membrane protein n=1 Tax=Galerina marginata (strain CBS 339.88) TaxID=685588 RepID=A0A067SDU6_GALM3|nr:hypothetical protein GALMADRAFT_934629 [Galerina marginata CBS 339.88]